MITLIVPKQPMEDRYMAQYHTPKQSQAHTRAQHFISNAHTERLLPTIEEMEDVSFAVEASEHGLSPRNAARLDPAGLPRITEAKRNAPWVHLHIRNAA